MNNWFQLHAKPAYMRSERKRFYMLRLLVLDDERAFRDGLIDRLLEAGHEAVGVDTAALAFDRFASDSIDVVIMNYRLRKDIGARILRRIRACWQRMPLLLIIGAQQDELAVIERLSLGADTRKSAPRTTCPH